MLASKHAGRCTQGTLAQVLRGLHELQDVGQQRCSRANTVPATHTRLICSAAVLHVAGAQHCAQGHSSTSSTVKDMQAEHSAQAADPELSESSITTTSSTLKIAAVRAICPATAVACSADWVLSMTEAATAMDRVGGEGCSSSRFLSKATSI